MADDSPRARAIALLREFDARLDARPDHAERARATPLPELLRSMQGRVDGSILDAYLRAVDDHGLTWADIRPDVYAFAAEVIVEAIRR
jgi:hypothetical protein